MTYPTSFDFEEARKRNVNANDLAMLPEAFDAERLPQRMGIELKVDGIGILDVNGHLQSLEGVAFEAARHLAHELDAIRQVYGTEMVLHGEFFEPQGFNATLSSFRSGQSKSGAIVLWDALTLKAWHGYEQSLPLYVRHGQLKAAFEAVRPSMVALSRLIEAGAPDAAMIDAALDTALESGHEGLVVKDLDSPYRRGRSHYWMKVKPTTTIDVPIQSFRLDDDGLIKSFVVTVAGKPVLIGSGISEALRHQPDQFWSGRIVEIRHVGMTEKGQLRGCSFLRFRDDKHA